MPESSRPSTGHKVPRESHEPAVQQPARTSPVGESTPRLMVMLAHAASHLGFNKLPLATRQRLVSVLGLTALFTPLGLWISWNPAMLVGFTVLGVSCVAVLLLIVWLSPEDEL